jgi:membrane protein
MIWLHRKLLKHSHTYRRFIKWTKGYIIPGFGTLSLYETIAPFIDDFMQGTMLNKASALAYNFMLAFFPAVLFVFTLIPYIHIKNFQPMLFDVVSSILPTNAYIAFQKTIEDIIVKQNGKLLSFGVIAALYFATNGVNYLMRAFNSSSLIIEKRSWLKRRMIATALTIVISISLLIAIVIMIAGQSLIGLLQSHVLSKSHFWIYLLLLSRWLIIIIIFFVTISLLYRYGPAHKLKWPFLNPGSILATGLAVLTSLGFTYYINNFSSYNKLYGSIGTLIVVMIWLYLNSLILLIGFELNASIDLSKRSIKVIKPRFNTFRVNKYGE